MLTKSFSKWLALSVPLCFATYADAQSAPSQNPAHDNDITRSAPDRDTNRGDLSRFDRFLDDHREIAEQLLKDPSLANNKQFLKNHPALEGYLRQNPGIRDALRDNPNAFMSAEGRFDRNEAYRGELANFDRFLDAHRDIAPQLRKNPALVDNRQYLNDHPELQSYLQNHPEIREQIDRNPNGFMQQESSYERYEDSHNRDSDRGELANFDRFLDSHHGIAAQLQKDPSLVENQQYLKDHPELQSYLQDHPAVREQIDRNPNGFMQQENSYERYEDSRNRDSDRGELANFDRFLDSHHGIAAQLQKDPSLVENQQYLKDHPELQSYLQDHPAVREQIDRNPNGFMQQENSYERYEDSRNNNRGPVAGFDQFLDSHREISEQLQKHPSLADDKQFLKDHPALQSYLQQHPEVREQLAQNPNAFMSQEARYERSGDDRSMDRYASNDRDRNNSAYDRDHNNKYDRDRDVAYDRDRSNNSNDDDRNASRHFGEFLGSHQDIAEQLSKNPSLAKDHDYLQIHPELQEYLNTHPEVRKQLTSNPDSFLTSAQQFNSNGQGGQTGKMPAPPSTQPKPKP